jgi:hypothetical protein
MQGLIHPHCSTWFACEEGLVLAIEGAMDVLVISLSAE